MTIDLNNIFDTFEESINNIDPDSLVSSLTVSDIDAGTIGLNYDPLADLSAIEGIDADNTEFDSVTDTLPVGNIEIDNPRQDDLINQTAHADTFTMAEGSDVSSIEPVTHDYSKHAHTSLSFGSQQPFYTFVHTATTGEKHQVLEQLLLAAKQFNLTGLAEKINNLLASPQTLQAAPQQLQPLIREAQNAIGRPELSNILRRLHFTGRGKITDED